MVNRDNSNFHRRIDWNLFRTFREIVRAEGVTRAAEELARKQSAVSLALKRFEDHLGFKLCRRGPSGFSLTDEGLIVAEACESLHTLISGLPNRIDKLAEQLVGRVNIKMISSIVCKKLDTAIQNFHVRHPQVQIGIDISTWDTVAGSLLREVSDIGLSPVRHFRADLEYKLLFEEVHRPYCSSEHPLFGRTFDDASELRNEPFVLTGNDEPDELTAYRINHGLGASVAGLSDSPEEAMRLTKLGVGICFLPDGLAADAVDQNQLWPLLSSDSAPRLGIYVITNPAAHRHLARDRLVHDVLTAEL